MSLRAVAKAYPTLLLIGLREAVAYRAEFLVWMLTMTLPLVMMALWTAVAREGNVGRYDADTFVAYYLATLIVRQMASTWVVWEMNAQIREGTLALNLLRPIHPLWIFSAESLAAMPMRAAVSVPLALVALAIIGGKHVCHDPVVWLLWPVAIAGAWLISFCVSAMIGTLALYLESSVAVYELWLGLFAVLSGYLVPLDLFPPWVTRLAHALPFAYLQAFPVEMMIGLRSRTEVLEGLFVQWLYAVGAVACLAMLWRRALKRFAAYGG